MQEKLHQSLVRKPANLFVQDIVCFTQLAAPKWQLCCMSYVELHWSYCMLYVLCTVPTFVKRKYLPSHWWKSSTNKIVSINLKIDFLLFATIKFNLHLRFTYCWWLSAGTELWDFGRGETKIPVRFPKKGTNGSWNVDISHP